MIPESLVTAATKAICIHEHMSFVHCDCRNKARAALAAAFAALPECEEAVSVVGFVTPAVHDVLAALAKEFGS